MKTKENPVKAHNRAMRERYMHHLCLHCSNLSYWDWYICRKRIFTFWDFGVKELIKLWKRRFSWGYGDSSFRYWLRHLFDIDQFIPDKPIKKCKFYEYSDRKVFWTKVVEQDGTTWIDDGEDINEDSMVK
jgi:hypothetical protein